MIGSREELEQNLIEVMSNKKIKSDKKIVNDIKNEFRKYKIIDTQKWISNPEVEIPKLDNRSFFLLTEQVYLKTGAQSINPDEYFTEQEKKKSRQYIGTYELGEQIDFPLTLENFTQLSYNEYVGVVPMNTIAKLSASMKLHYNFNIQRESKKRKINGVIVEEAKLVKQNVIEIKDHIKNRTLKPTQLVYNAAIGTADHGESELIYDSQTRQLTITRGTILDIVDGYHRTKGTEMAYHEIGELDGSFIVLITNYDDEDAKNYQGQLAQATPIAKERADELLGKRMADAVLKEVLPKTELKDKVSSNRFVHSNELVPYKVLAETIEEQFKLEKALDVYKVSGFLVKYFNYLLGAFEEEFITKYEAVKKKSFINEGNMFIGYIVLARRLMENNEDPSKVVEILSKINFDKDNSLWREIGFINEEGKQITNTTRKAIADYFENLDIE